MTTSPRTKRPLRRRVPTLVHGAEWWMCSRCQGLFPASHFSKQKRRDGRCTPHTHCKECRRAYARRPEVKAQTRAWRRAFYATPAGRERLLANSRRSYQKHRERHLKRFRQHYEKNKFNRVVGWRVGKQSKT